MTQLLKKFDNVLLASMKKANNNPIPNTIRINGVLLQACSSSYTYERYSSLMQNYYASFNPDGTKVYFTRHNTGTGSGTGYDPIIMYNLVTPWDVSSIIANGMNGLYAIPAAVSINTDTVAGLTAQGHCFSPDGTKIFVCNTSTGVLRKFTVGTPWDITTMSLSTSATTYGASLNVVKFTPDGLTMVLLGTGGLKKYTLNSAWDIIGGTLISTAASGFASDFDFQNNGLYLFTFNGSNLIRYTLSSPYNITGITATQTLNLTGGPYIGSTPVINFKDGFKGFISSYNGNAPCIISAFNLTCSFDISNPLVIPTPTPTPTPTLTPFLSQTPTPTVTPTISFTPTMTLTPTVTRTMTPTPTITQTLTPSPTSNPVVSNCAVLFNSGSNVYSYNVSVNTLTLLTVPNFPNDSNDIAHSFNGITGKLWGVDDANQIFVEYNITLPSFTASFSRNISYSALPFISSYGLASISNTVILAVNTFNNPNEVVEIDVSGASPVMTTKFPMVINSRVLPNISQSGITGDFYKTTTNKFIALNYMDEEVEFDTIRYCYITQWNYLTGEVEVDKRLLDIGCGTYGLFEDNGNIYITESSTFPNKLYIINQNPPYDVSYVREINNINILGASQIPSCLTASLNFSLCDYRIDVQDMSSAACEYRIDVQDMSSAACEYIIDVQETSPIYSCEYIIDVQETSPIYSCEYKIDVSCNCAPFNLIWEAKNLEVTTYRNGDTIPQATTNTDWVNYGNSGIGAWSYYLNLSSNGPIYGKLYNWFAVNDSRGLAPLGYHVPTNDEWTTFTDCLGGTLVAGGKMKSTGTGSGTQLGTGLWQSPNNNATNESGWTGLPGGDRMPVGVFTTMGEVGNWWSSSEVDATNAYYRGLSTYDGSCNILFWDKKYGLSVRLIKDYR